MTEVSQAIALLRDETLVHSEDFELIRLPLASLLERLAQTPSHQFDDEIADLVHPILTGETAVKISEPLEAWIQSSARALGIYRVAANESPAFRDLMRKVFRNL
jgi:hypothetical protein